MENIRFIGLIVLRPDVGEKEFQVMLRSLTNDAKKKCGGEWNVVYEKVLRTKENAKKRYINRFGKTILLDSYWYQIIADVEKENVRIAESFLVRNAPTCNSEAYPMETEVIWAKTDRLEYIRKNIKRIDGECLII